jgi:hypothetical protein
MQAMRWPAELRLVKTMTVANAAAFLSGRPNWPTRIKIQQYASQEAQVGGWGLAVAQASA